MMVRYWVKRSEATQSKAQQSTRYTLFTVVCSPSASPHNGARAGAALLWAVIARTLYLAQPRVFQTRLEMQPQGMEMELTQVPRREPSFLPTAHTDGGSCACCRDTLRCRVCSFNLNNHVPAQTSVRKIMWPRSAKGAISKYLGPSHVASARIRARKACARSCVRYRSSVQGVDELCMRTKPHLPLSMINTWARKTFLYILSLIHI